MTLFSTQLNIIHMALITSGDGPSSPNAPEFCLQTPQMAAETSGKKRWKERGEVSFGSQMSKLLLGPGGFQSPRS